MHYSRKYICLIAVLALFVTRAKAGDTLRFDVVEQRSYALYLRSSWDTLEHYCDAAIAQGFDYYYLRIRAGVACFQRKRYRKASVHFEKALVFNAGDDIASEYLYYSYLYSGEYEQAHWLSTKFDTTFAQKIGIGTQSKLSMLVLEGGPKVSDDTRFQTATYVQGGLSHYAGNRVSLFHALTYYRQDESRYAIRQYQYYLEGTVPLHHRWTLSAAGHLIYDKNSYSDTVFMPPPPMGPGGQAPPPRREIRTTDVTEFSGIFALSVNKSNRFLSYGAGITFWKNDSLLQSQLNGSIYYYPFASNLLSIGGNIYAHSMDELKNVYLSFAPALRVNVKRWSFAAMYTHNMHNNAVEYTGYGINNSEDLSPDRYTLLISCPVAKRLSLYGAYSYETKEMAQTGLAYSYNAYIFGIRFTPY